MFVVVWRAVQALVAQSLQVEKAREIVLPLVLVVFWVFFPTVLDL